MISYLSWKPYQNVQNNNCSHSRLFCVLLGTVCKIMKYFKTVYQKKITVGIDSLER